ncbi:hypothetical protein GCM10020219_038320 [Nonomuraea dietziae]
MLSASHNPAPDNGIKFLARGGFKLSDTVEARDLSARATATERWDERPVGFGGRPG